MPLATSTASNLPSVGYLHCSITLLQVLLKLTSSAASTLPIKCWLLTLFNYFASIACETQYLTIKCWLLYIACENRYCMSDKAYCHSHLVLQAPFLSYGYLQCSITLLQLRSGIKLSDNLNHPTQAALQRGRWVQHLLAQMVWAIPLA